MQCISPVSVVRPEGKGPSDRITVPCGQCAECLMNRRSSWSFRLLQEQKRSISSYFLTLTYSDENLIYGENDAILFKSHVQLFLKRLRKELSRPVSDYQIFQKVSEKGLKSPTIKYYVCGEYGSITNRPHYHGIFFNLPYGLKNIVDYQKLLTILRDTWQYGDVDIGHVTSASIHYVTGYMMSDDEKLCLISKNIGSNYLTDQNIEYHKNNLFTHTYMENGIRVNLPRYYREKIFNEFEKEEIRIQKTNVSIKRYNQERQEVLKTGSDPELYALNKREQFINRIKRQLKKTKV